MQPWVLPSHDLLTEPSLAATVAVKVRLRESTSAEKLLEAVAGVESQVVAVPAVQLVVMSSAPAVVGLKLLLVPSTKATWHSLAAAAARVLAEDILAFWA